MSSISIRFVPIRILLFKFKFNDPSPRLRPWSRVRDDKHHLVDSFNNDPYYPRPRSDSPLYQKFCLGYVAVYPQVLKDAAELAETFLRAIEAEQAKRDALRTFRSLVCNVHFNALTAKNTAFPFYKETILVMS